MERKKTPKNENNHALLTFIKKNHLKYQTRKKSKKKRKAKKKKKIKLSKQKKILKIMKKIKN